MTFNTELTEQELQILEEATREYEEDREWDYMAHTDIRD